MQPLVDASMAASSTSGLVLDLYTAHFLFQLWLALTATAMPHHAKGNSLACSQQFVFHQSFCYRYFGTDLQKPFHHAQKLCSRYESFLVSLHSLQEEVYITELTNLNHSSIWLGLNDEDGSEAAHREGIFKWSSGEKFEPELSSTYCNWKIGEPENKRHLDCVKMDMDGWAMAPGGCGASRMSFVCKKKACPAGHTWGMLLGTCTPQGSDTDMPNTTIKATPTEAPTYMISLLLMLFLLSTGAVGGVCCYGYAQTRTISRTELLPT